MVLDNQPNRVEWCDFCGHATVICGRCNNNACNGGSGVELDGSKCKQCDSAYKQMMEIPYDTIP